MTNKVFSKNQKSDEELRKENWERILSEPQLDFYFKENYDPAPKGSEVNFKFEEVRYKKILL